MNVLNPRSISRLRNCDQINYSYNDRVTGKISALAARDNATPQIRIHAIDAGSIHGMISNYHLE